MGDEKGGQGQGGLKGLKLLSYELFFDIVPLAAEGRIAMKPHQTPTRPSSKEALRWARLSIRVLATAEISVRG